MRIKLHRRTISSWVWPLAAAIVIFSLLLLLPSLRVHAGAGVACNGNNLIISWSGLNTPVSVDVNGTTVITNGHQWGGFRIACGQRPR
jgi:hypothetical protein